MQTTFNFFVSAPRDLESLLASEMTELGITEVKPARSGVYCQCTLAEAYRICLWSRIANRVFLPLAEFPAATPEALYDGVKAIEWEEHLNVRHSLAIDVTLTKSQIKHSQYAAQKTKDAIVDLFRERYDERPSVDLHMPDIRINAHIQYDKAIISLDLSGESLHRRGYRMQNVPAPLKENLAATLLKRAQWERIAKERGSFVDPMCGSGTLLIEAAWMAGDIAPSLDREHFGFNGWLQHDPEAWKQLREEAEERKQAGLKNIPPIYGYDEDIKAVRASLTNVKAAGMEQYIHVEKRALMQFEGLPHDKGLLVTNPPYGERLGEIQALQHLYGYLGDGLKKYYENWDAAVLTHSMDLGKQLGIRAHKKYSIHNGALACKLLCFHVTDKWFMHQRVTKVIEPEQEQSPQKAHTQNKVETYSEGARMFANRLRKNMKKLSRWLKKESVSCYRLYDADMPEYSAAIDVYENWVHIQEYAAPKEIDPEKARKRLQEIEQVTADVLNVPAQQVFVKVRKQQKGREQYTKQSQYGKFYDIKEGDATLLANFTDYLDTGLFLDHRPMRRLIQQSSKGKRFLNLFAYTGTATVFAALGGAKETTTVDMSHTYLAWAKRNLARNGFTEKQHEFVQQDCFQWLEQQASASYDLIFLDPPTFSNSKRMENTLDIQRDHVALIQAALRCLHPKGTLLFSTNNRRFNLDEDELLDVEIKNISPELLPPDFARRPKIHQCWRICHKGND